MRVWIDLDNSPHVPFFVPIMRELSRRGHEVVVTARDYAQTLELASVYGLPVEPVGGYGGRNRLRKLSNLAQRAWQLYRTMQRRRPDIALSHGSRAQAVAARFLGIPAVVCLDYEWTERWIFRWTATVFLVPEVLATAAHEAGLPAERLRTYPGLKEEVYLPEFRPQADFRQHIGIDDDTCLVVLRPPSITANYRTTQSVRLFEAVLHRLGCETAACGVLLPRSSHDREWVETLCRQHRIGNIRILDRVVPGLQLLYWADVVISGGGTMNREAALLGTPVYSVFGGRLGAVDRWLCAQGKLQVVQSLADVDTVRFERHRRSPAWCYPDKGLAAAVATCVEACWRSCHSR